MNDKYIITGTGKCGTTFLIQLLSHLGLDTGFTSEEADEGIRPGKGGLEWEIRGKRAKVKDQPKIIKCPRLCTDLLSRAEKFNWNILHLYISIRDVKDVAAHRVKRWKENPKGKWKGLTEDELMKIHEGMCSGHLSKLMYQLADTKIPYTFIKFPQSVRDAEYCRLKIGEMVSAVCLQEFHKIHAQIANPDLIRWDSDGVFNC